MGREKVGMPRSSYSQGCSFSSALFSLLILFSCLPSSPCKEFSVPHQAYAETTASSSSVSSEIKRNRNATSISSSSSSSETISHSHWAGSQRNQSGNEITILQHQKDLHQESVKGGDFLTTMVVGGGGRRINDRAIVLPLKYKQLNSRTNFTRVNAAALWRGRERNLGEASMWLYGHVLITGYYYMLLLVGSPPQQFELIVDTGSTVTYVPCATCGPNCGSHQDSPFVPAASSSYRAVMCTEEAACPYSQCDSKRRCSYARHYAENSTSSGFLASDVISFGDASTMGPLRIVFGCETLETGDLFTQKADGIIGMGRGYLSIVDQLVEQGAMDDVFSICYGGMEMGGGAMILGRTTLPSDTTFVDLGGRGGSTYYTVQMMEIHVGGKPLQLRANHFNQGYGVVLDSGTTFTYLPNKTFEAFRHAVEGVVLPHLRRVPGPDPNYHDVCFGGAPSNSSELSSVFPSVKVEFGGGVTYSLAPENYLFKHRDVKGGYCLGVFANADEGTLIGGIFMRNTLVTYDREKSRVGFWKTDCYNLFDYLPDFQQSNAPPPPPAQPDTSTSHLPGKGSGSPSVPTVMAPGGNTSSGNSSVRSGQEQGCGHCALRIDVSMTLGTDVNAFEELTPEFLDDMERELSVQRGQVELDEYNAVDPVGVRLKLRIIPSSSESVLPSDAVERIEHMLVSHQLRLRDAFGKYEVMGVIVRQANGWQGGPRLPGQWVAMAGGGQGAPPPPTSQWGAWRRWTQRRRTRGRRWTRKCCSTSDRHVTAPHPVLYAQCGWGR